MKAVRLRTEYLNDPIGIDTQRPRLSWNCEGGVTQTAFQVVAGDSDSGKVESFSMHTFYPDTLHSREIINWRVRLWDENDKPGEWTDASFEMGLITPDDWKAEWISGDYRPKKKVRYPADYFRKKFITNGKIAKARLYASAHGLYDVTINEHRIEDFVLAPGSTDYRKRIQYQTYDVTDLLTEKNNIVIRLADGWFRGSVAAYGVTNVFGTETSIIAQLEITYSDGSTETVVTDGSWEWTDNGPVRFADLKDGEIYDASMKPAYYRQAKVVHPKHVPLVASDNVPVTEHEHFTPVKAGNVYDFGQNIAGYISFRIKGKKGNKVRFVLGEKVTGGHVDMSGIQETKPEKGWSQMSLIKKLTSGKVSGECDVTPKQEIIFTCSGDEDFYKTSFAIFGFQYAEVTGDAEISDIEAIAVYSDMEQTGEFTCSDSKVNKLVENTRWSMKSNFCDVPTDCPTRERLGWTGDAQIFFDTGAYLSDTSSFFLKWLRDMADAQYRDGTIPAVIPYNGVEMMYKATGVSVGWADAIYLVPYRFYRMYGDERDLDKYYPMMKKYGDYLLSHCEKDGHYEKGVHLGEWLEPEEFREKKYGAGMKHPEECTAYLYFAMNTLSEIAEKTGHNDDASKYREAAELAKRVYPKYAEIDTDRQAKLVRPLALGLYDGEMRKKAQERLKKAVENYDYRVGTGFLSTPFILGELTKAGFSDTAYRMLLNEKNPGWLYEIDQGATTIWEDWEGRLSRNHYSPGAVCQWLFDTAAGIRLDGENHFMIAPVPGAFDRLEASYRSVYGKVKSSWEKTGSGYKYHISVPSNCTADINLPGMTEITVKAGTYEYEI